MLLCVKRLLASSIPLLALLVCNCAANTSHTKDSDPAIPRYDLRIKLLPDAHRIEGSGTMLIPSADKPREAIELKLNRQMRGLGVEVLEPAESAGIAGVDEKESKDRNTIWAIRPPRPVPAAKPLRLRLSWRGGEDVDFVFYIGPEASFASGVNTAWYPMTEGGYGYGTMEVTVPIGYTVHARGIQRSTPDETGQAVFRFENKTPSYFSFAAGRYTVIRRTGKFPVSVYLLHPRKNIDEYVTGCLSILETLEKEFGPYPYEEFAIVEVLEDPASQAGFTGASVEGFILAISQFLDQEFNLAYYGHEISHQWWGNMIKRSGARGSWMLDEAMAQYGSMRVVETIEGEDMAERYRRSGYPGYYPEYSGVGYLKNVAAGRDRALSDLPSTGGSSRQISGSKGAFVLDLLSRTIRRENFRAILEKFTRQHAFKRVTWEEFLEAIELGAGRDMKWFYEQWFEKTGAPDWQITWEQDGETLRGLITQSPPYYRATLDVQAEGGGQKIARPVEVNGARTEFSLKANFSAQKVILDPHFLVLRWTPEYSAEIMPGRDKRQ